MGHDTRLKYIVVMMVAVQIFSAYLMRDASWLSILVVGYLWGGVINHRYITPTIGMLIYANYYYANYYYPTIS